MKCYLISFKTSWTMESCWMQIFLFRRNPGGVWWGVGNPHFGILVQIWFKITSTTMLVAAWVCLILLSPPPCWSWVGVFSSSNGFLMNRGIFPLDRDDGHSLAASSPSTSTQRNRGTKECRNWQTNMEVESKLYLELFSFNSHQFLGLYSLMMKILIYFECICESILQNS